MAKRISIINFKGGVGKTTLAFHLGTGLAWLHDAKVLLVDMDHQSSLSVLCLGDGGWEKAVSDGRTVTEVFAHFIGQRQDMPDDNLITTSPMYDIDSDYDSMDIVSASLRLDDLEIELTSTIRGNPIESEWNKRTLLCRWIEEERIDEMYDYIIFDCPPATKIASQNAIAASHGYIVPVVPETVMSRGTPHLINMISNGIDRPLKGYAGLSQHRKIHVPDTKLVGLVVARIQTGAGGNFVNIARQELATLERDWGNYLIEPFIQQGVGVNDALAKGIPVYNDWENPNVAKIKNPLNESYVDLTYNIKAEIDRL